jgi:hypothetical protein
MPSIDASRICRECGFEAVAVVGFRTGSPVKISVYGVNSSSKLEVIDAAGVLGGVLRRVYRPYSGGKQS